MDYEKIKSKLKTFEKIQSSKISGDRIKRIFDEQEFQTTFGDLVRGAPQEIHNDLLHFAAEIIDAVTASLQHVDDDDEIQYLLAIHYMSLKCEWVLYNCKFNYTIMATGKDPSQLEVYKASVTTALISHVEPYLNDQAVKVVSEMLESRIRNALEGAA